MRVIYDFEFSKNRTRTNTLCQLFATNEALPSPKLPLIRHRRSRHQLFGPVTSAPCIASLALIGFAAYSGDLV